MDRKMNLNKSCIEIRELRVTAERQHGMNLNKSCIEIDYDIQAIKEQLGMNLNKSCIEMVDHGGRKQGNQG